MGYIQKGSFEMYAITITQVFKLLLKYVRCKMYI